jgi:hypothetical protein
MTNIVKKYNTLIFAFVLEYFQGVVNDKCHPVKLEKRTLEVLAKANCGVPKGLQDAE